MNRCTTLAIALLCLPLVAAEDAYLETAREIEDCVRRQIQDRSSEQDVSFTTTDRVGSESDFEAKVYWRQFDDGLSRFLIKLEAPADMRGAGLLLVEKRERHDMFMYMPELKRARRVTTRMVSSSLFGTDFSYEEIARLQGIWRDDQLVRIADAVEQGRSVYVLEGHPKEDEGSAYDRVVTYVDRETCIPLKISYYERGEQPRKELITDPNRVATIEGRRVPKRLVMRDLRDETSTELLVDEIDLGKPLRRELFSQRYLESSSR